MWHRAGILTAMLLNILKNIIAPTLVRNIVLVVEMDRCSTSYSACLQRAGQLHDGDEVIVPANTYIATILAITETTLRPY